MNSNGCRKKKILLQKGLGGGEKNTFFKTCGEKGESGKET